MPARRHAYVFAYDIRRDTARSRVAALLEERLVRVQKSVFEGRMTPGAARRLAQRIRIAMGPDDSLRVYALTEDALAASFVHAATPLPEASGYMIL
jgi:CRISPR-associated protein Cas2